MNANIKALQLIEKYKSIIGHSDLNVCPTDDLEIETNYTAIDCAISDVQETLNALNEIPELDHIGNSLLYKIEYYQEIKEILNNKS